VIAHTSEDVWLKLWSACASFKSATINYTDVVAACRQVCRSLGQQSRRRLSTDAGTRSHASSDRKENSQIGARSDPVISSFICPHHVGLATRSADQPQMHFTLYKYIANKFTNFHATKARFFCNLFYSYWKCRLPLHHMQILILDR